MPVAVPALDQVIKPSDFESYFYFLGTYVIDGLLVERKANLEVYVRQGQCKIGGIVVKANADESIAIQPQTTNHVYFELNRNNDNEITGATLGVTSNKTVDSDRIYLAAVTVAAALPLSGAQIVSDNDPRLRLVDYSNSKLIEFDGQGNAANAILVKNSTGANPVEVTAISDSTSLDVKFAPLGSGSAIIASGKLDGTKYVRMNQDVLDSNQIDFNTNQFQTRNMTANTVLTGTNYGNGKCKTIRLVNTTSSVQTLTFPQGWKFLGPRPPNQAAGKTAILSLCCFGGCGS